MAKKPVSDTFTFDRLCSAFGLKAGMEDYEDLHERNIDYFFSIHDGAEKEALRDGKDPAEADEIGAEAAAEANDRMYEGYEAAAVGAIEKMAEEFFDLNVIEIKGKPGKTPTTYKVKPIKSWKQSGEKIVEAINGVGYFYFRDFKDLMRSGPYTEREAVLSHLHYLADIGSIYGTTSLQRKFDDDLDHFFRYRM